MTQTTGLQVIERFAGRSASAAARLHAWRQDPSKAAVVPVVEAHAVRALYGISSDDVRSVCERTEHALGEVRKRDIEGVELVRDWHPAFAFTHVLHLAVEATGGLPTYQEFRQYCREDQRGRRTLWEPAEDLISQASSAVGRERARAAVRWRIGNAYYSFVRETYVLAVLRESGLAVEVHPLADALFRVDLWVQDVNVSLYIGNTLFRAGESGRKDRPDVLLSDATPAFVFREVQLATQHRFGVVHLPQAQQITQTAHELSSLADLSSKGP